MSYLAHRTAYRIQKSSAGIIHQVPAVGDLHGLWCGLRCGLAVSATAIARDDGDLGVSSEPSFHRCGFPIWQQVNYSPPFQVAQQRAVALATLPGEVIDTKDIDGVGSVWKHASSHHPEQCIFAHRQHQVPRRVGARAPTQCNTEMVDDRLQP